MTRITAFVRQVTREARLKARVALSDAEMWIDVYERDPHCTDTDKEAIARARAEIQKARNSL